MGKISKIIKELSTVKDTIKYNWKDSKVYPSKPKKPEVINLLANDICNSKCVMCNIWKQKQDFEFSPEQLEKILRDDLFSEVKSVGITGGEPTLRKDLPQLYEALCKALPKLNGAGIITNAIKDKDVIQHIKDSYKILQQHGKKLGVMVSLDGYGEAHDRNRNRSGNFESAMRVINFVREETDLPLYIGCTITKENVWDVDELLDFIIEEKLAARFRVAEYIDRLYNNDLTETIRNFTAEEKYHLACFFQRLINHYEKNDLYKRTYKSIISILSGGERTIGCPYHNNGIVLDSRGNIQYCAPKSKVIGNALEQSSMELYQNNLEERKRIREENCSDCIHDYHAPITIPELKQKYKEEWYDKIYGLKYTDSLGKWYAKFIPKVSYSRTTIFITGWYGTETVGDKAILAGILEYYKKEYKGEVDFIISAIYPFVTERTLVELEVKAEVVPVKDARFIQSAKSADITVMGGGPLMELETLSVPKTAFHVAKSAGKKTVVFGCGIGPLYQKKYIDAVRDILQLSDEIRLRDSNSVAWAKDLVSGKKIELFGDPAYHYLKGIAAQNKPQKKNVLACFLRDWDIKYKENLSEEEFRIKKEDFEKNIATAIRKMCQDFHLVPHFYCMHTFVAGGDDRVFYRKFIGKYFQNMECYLEERPSTVDIIVNAMQSSSYNLCMRFHSVLFAHTLETNFIAIDYTQGGKITGFLTDNNCLERNVSPLEIADNANFDLSSVVTKL